MEVLKPSANVGTKVGGGAGGATSRLTEGGKNEKVYLDQFHHRNDRHV